MFPLIWLPSDTSKANETHPFRIEVSKTGLAIDTLLALKIQLIRQSR